MDNYELLRELLGNDAVAALSPQDRSALVAGDGEWIRQLVRARAELPIEAPSALLSQSLRDVFDAQLLVKEFETILVSDSRIDRRLVGVRGPATVDAWSLTFACEAADILLDVVNRHDRVVVDAHVMSHGAEPVAYQVSSSPVVAPGAASLAISDESLGPALTSTIESDRFGRVHLGTFAATAYHFTFANLRSIIHLEADFGAAR